MSNTPAANNANQVTERKVIERANFIAVELPPATKEPSKEVSRKIQELWKKQTQPQK